MSYIGAKPIPVTIGGTGQITLGNHEVLVGTGTAAVAAIGGSDGTLCVATTSSNPAFGNTSAGSFTFSANSAGNTISCTVENTDNTNSASSAALSSVVGGSGSGPTRYQFVIPSGTNNYAVGINNAATSPEDDPWNQVQGTTPGSVVNVALQKSGLANFPRTTCCLARLGTQVDNVTGNSGTYTLGSGTTLTEIFDQHNDLNANGRITAAITGKYDVKGYITVINLLISHTFHCYITTDTRTYYFEMVIPAIAGSMTVKCEALCDLDAGDIATISCDVTGEVANTVDISAGTTVVSYICGRLVA